jgi:hypothetical protein
MPVDVGQADDWVIPGLWEAIRGRYLANAERSDPRGLGMSPEERAELDASPYSGPSAARAALASMVKRGWVETWPPSAREFGEAVSSARRVRVYADNTIKPA